MKVGAYALMRVTLTVCIGCLAFAIPGLADAVDLLGSRQGSWLVVVPEPETIVLLGIALVAFAVYGLYMRKKRKIK